MRIVSLDPFLTEIVSALGLGEQLVAVSHRCDSPESVSSLPRVTVGRELQNLATAHTLSLDLCADFVLLENLRNANPDVVLGSIPVAPDYKPLDLEKTVAQIETELGAYLARTLRFRAFYPLTLEGVYECIEEIAKDLKVAAKGRELAQRMKAQCMDWGDNFYDRMRNKRVTFLSGVEPFTLAGFWIPDLLNLASCVAQHAQKGFPDKEIEWAEIVAFRPDVIVIAPRGMTVKESVKLFKTLEQLPDWQDLLAVKRGEVCFCDGEPHFYRASPRLVDSMGILISAIAGLESGYITKRDSFFRLRWLELHRHKI